MATLEVSSISIPEQQKSDDHSPFPGVLSPSPTTPTPTLPETLHWIETHREFINSKLVEHGALLFRGFPVSSAEDFHSFINQFGYDLSENLYLGGGGPRNKIIGPVHTSTESPPEFLIPYHHELAYLPHHPSKLFFWCEVEPAADGETPILLSHRIVSRLQRERSDLYQLMKSKKIRYHRVIADKTTSNNKYQKSWQDIFFTQDPKEAEKRARESGHEVVEWLGDGSMKVVSKPMDVIRMEERAGKETWFNSMVLLHPASYDNRQQMGNWVTTFDDYTPIQDEDVKFIRKVMIEEGMKFKWRKGDVILVDNFLSLHSRNSFTPPRRILAAMVN